MSPGYMGSNGRCEMGLSTMRERDTGKQVVTLPSNYGLATLKLGANDLSVLVKTVCGLYDVEVGDNVGGQHVVRVLQGTGSDWRQEVFDQGGMRGRGLVAGAAGTPRTCGGGSGGVGLGHRGGSLFGYARRATAPRRYLEAGRGGVRRRPTVLLPIGAWLKGGGNDPTSRRTHQESTSLGGPGGGCQQSY